MTVPDRIAKFLKENKVKYKTQTHVPAYTAQEIAAAQHVPGKELAKTVIVKVDGKFAMAVLPASYRIDFDALKGLVKAKEVKLAGEEEFAGLFPGVETGAMPPFGNLYDLPVYAESSLREDETITFNAGTHVETITMAYADFERLVKPTIGSFGIHA